MRSLPLRQDSTPFQPSLGLRPPARRATRLDEVAAYWLGSPELPDYPGNIDMGEPFCAACGWRVPYAPEPIPVDFASERRRIEDNRRSGLLTGWEFGACVSDLDAREAKAAQPETDEAWHRRQWRWASRFIDRAHLVDYAADGRDDPDNMVPLCQRCHRKMPPFDVGQRADALAWVRSVPFRPWQFQMFTDGFAEMYPDRMRALVGRQRTWPWLRDMWTLCMEAMAQAARP